MYLARWRALSLIGCIWWISSASLTEPAIANENAAEDLIAFAIEPWRPANPGIGLVRWPVQPSVTLHFLAKNMSAEEAAAVEYVNDFRQKCSCISAVSVVTRGDRIERRQNDILILIDKNGFASFLDQTPEEIKTTFGTASQLNENFPRTLPKSRSKTESSFRFLADREHVLAVTAVISVNEKLEGLRSVLAFNLLAGLNPALAQSPDLIQVYVKDAGTSGDEMKIPTPAAYDLLRHLFSSKIVPGMMPEDVRRIEW
ncbi:hypothetical protein [Dongia sp.]|uniref:hypothetical protein n=1 Tax=Dongia sp. TaxID=1977262 RepID=UPI0035AF85CC